MTSRHTTLYRDKHNGKLMGVCAGIADYTGINALWVRLGALVSIPLTGGWIIPLYFLAGLLLNNKPPHLYADEREQKYWQRVRQGPRHTAREVRGRLRELNRRLAEVEKHYVSSNRRLSAEIERLR